MSIRKNLSQNFFANALAYPEKTALFVDGREISYCELASRATAISRQLIYEVDSKATIALLGADTFDIYAALLGALHAGIPFVPLSPWFPTDYLRELISKASPSFLLFDRNGVKHINDISLPSLEISSVTNDDDWKYLSEPSFVEPESIVHIMFTSGSTGPSKMVGQTLANIDAYLKASQERYGFKVDDRVSHFNELGWDPYLLDLFGAWDVGATTFCVPKSSRLAPAAFIREHKLTTWYSVPSVVNLLERLGALKGELFPSLRLTLFVGEPLQPATVEKWLRAAPNTLVENVYGPTECTVVCTGYEIDPSALANSTTPGRSHLPLGTPYAGCEIAILDPERHFLTAGEEGEIAISGPQLSTGYIGEPEKSAHYFIKLKDSNGEEKRWYLTGDRGMVSNDGNLHFLGRVDGKIKVMGNRVEVEAVESAIMKVDGAGEVAVVAGPLADGLTKCLLAAARGNKIPARELKRRVVKLLPSYMVPRDFIPLEEFPLNHNGKLDRVVLRERLLALDECA